jgi:catechol 2,3-dioxygenase-like lactoylglutathione lyase family enzyme
MAVERNFLTLLVDDPHAAGAFFTELLGYAPAFRSDWFVQLRAPAEGAVELGFLRRDHAIVPEALRAQRPAGGWLTVVVPDVDAAHEAARGRGVEVLEAPRDLFYGQRRMLIRGPEGLVVDVSSPCEPDPDWMKRVRPADDGAYEEA